VLTLYIHTESNMKTMTDLTTELDAAMGAHTAAEEHEKAASRDLVAARNRLNAAQKAVDAAVDEMRSKAPWNTDWYSKRHPGQPVTG
jgi:predicted  nucleic acid-binding Zn-ribbon protein